MAIVRGQKSTRADGNSTSIASSWATTPVAGQKAVVWIWQGGITTAPTSVVDNGSPQRTFTLDPNGSKIDATHNLAVRLYYADNIQPSGTYTVTASWASAPFASVAGIAYDNVATGGSTAGNSNSGLNNTSASSGAASSGDNSLYAAGLVDDGGSVCTQTAGGGFTKEQTLEDGTNFTEGGAYDLINATGSQNASVTLQFARNWNMVLAVWPEGAQVLGIEGRGPFLYPNAGR